MKKLYSYIIVFIIGGVLGYFARDFNTEVKTEKTKTTVITEGIDTSTLKKTIAVRSSAVISYQSYTPPDRPEAPQSKPAGEFHLLEEVAAWDTVTKEGFVANIKYFTKQKFFNNYFEIPERTITKYRTETITETEKITETVYRLPEWELGIGARGWLEDLNVSYAPYLLLQYNVDLWLVNASLGGKGVAVFEQGKVKLIPEVNAELKIGL
jgi:hypothetical protein